MGSGLWVCVLLGVALGVGSTSEVEEQAFYTQPLHIPRCCPDGYAFDPSRKCIQMPLPDFQPEVAIKGELMVALNVTEEVVDFTCDDREGEEKYVSLVNDPATLIQMSDGVNLLWIPPQGQPYEQHDYYCLAMERSTDPLPTVSYVAKICHMDAAARFERDKIVCAGASCVRKCCPLHQSLRNKMACTPVFEADDWQPSFSSSRDSIVPAPPPSDLLLVHGLPICETILVYNDHILLDTGEVSADGLLFPQHKYCIDYNNQTDTQEVEEMALICSAADEWPWSCPWKNVMLSVLMSISCVFLAITWIIYVSVPLLRGNNMGRFIISFVSAMFVSFVTLIILKHHREGFSAVQCTITATLTHLSILATFFWMNVMSYHIFCHLKMSHSYQRENIRSFLFHNLYAWGSSLLVALIGLILDATQADFIRPHFEIPDCWFPNQVALWLYQYGIMLILIVINIFFFVGSVALLRQRQRSGNHTETICAWVYLRIFIITGVLWTTEIFTWQASNQCQIVVVIFDIINSLQGIYIFLVCVCFRKDLKVFHCGWPQLATDTEGHVASDSAEITDLMEAPPRKD
ncbi:probable G-protein coupled receptor Mth-like 3 isoform X2 [Panulirus ornatus]